MNGSKKELEDRIAETQRMLQATEDAIERTRKLIDEARKILDEAQAGGRPGQDPPEPTR